MSDTDTTSCLGDRLIARVDQSPVDEGGGGSGLVAIPNPWVAPRALLVGLVALGLALLLAVQATRSLGRRERWARVLGTLAIAALLTPGCTLFGWGQKPLWQNVGITYFHQGFSPGPMLLTREDGTVLEERRFEPFGEELDAYTELVGGGSQTGPIDYTADSHNILNKQTDPATGWSYHGARWMAPETARWLTPDPPVKAPDPKFLAAPFKLHQYQYVDQNPVLHWDPDGEDKKHVVPAVPTGEQRIRISQALAAGDVERAAALTIDHYGFDIGEAKIKATYSSFGAGLEETVFGYDPIEDAILIRGDLVPTDPFGHPSDRMFAASIKHEARHRFQHQLDIFSDRPSGRAMAEFDAYREMLDPRFQLTWKERELVIRKMAVEHRTWRYNLLVELDEAGEAVPTRKLLEAKRDLDSAIERFQGFHREQYAASEGH